MVKAVRASLVDRLAAQGYPVDMSAKHAKFNFTITSISSSDVDVSKLILFANRVSEKLREMDFSCELADILVVLAVVGPESAAVKDKSSWRAKDRAYSYVRTLDYERWQAAKGKSRMEMIFHALVQIVQNIPDIRLDTQSKGALIQVLREALSG